MDARVRKPDLPVAATSDPRSRCPRWSGFVLKGQRDLCAEGHDLASLNLHVELGGASPGRGARNLRGLRREMSSLCLSMPGFTRIVGASTPSIPRSKALSL